MERLRKKLESETGEGWTQRRVASELGVTTQAYQNWIHGRRGKEIDLELLERLAATLHGDFVSFLKLARPDIYSIMKKYAKRL